MLVSRRVGADQAIGYVLSALGYAHRMDRDLPAAISTVDEAIQRFDRLGDDLARAQALNQLGCTHRDRGDFESAEAALSRARELRLGLGDRRGQLLTEINVAVLHAMSGDVDQGLHGRTPFAVRIRGRTATRSGWGRHRSPWRPQNCSRARPGRHGRCTRRRRNGSRPGDARLGGCG